MPGCRFLHQGASAEGCLLLQLAESSYGVQGIAVTSGEVHRCLVVSCLTFGVTLPDGTGASHGQPLPKHQNENKPSF